VLETMWMMVKILIAVTIAGIPLVLIAVWLKPKINLSSDAKEIIKFVSGILLITALIWLSLQE